MIIADWKEFFAAWKTATHATPQTVTQKDVALSPPVASSPSAKPAVGPIKIGTYKAEAIYTVIILKADGKGFFKGQTNQELKWKQTGSELVLKIYGEEDSLESKTYKAKVLSSKSFALGGLKYVILSPPVASSPSAKPTEDRKDPYEKLLKAVKKEPMGLECVPEELKTSELCFAAVKSHGFALEFVPERLKTPELCLLAVQNDKDPLFFATSALQFVPEALKTPELCLAAVKNHKYALEHVPDALKTSELCLLAVQNLGYALEHVPEEFKTPELCLLAVQTHGNALIYVPKAHRTLKLCIAAVQDDRDALMDVPMALRMMVKASVKIKNMF